MKNERKTTGGGGGGTTRRGFLRAAAAAPAFLPFARAAAAEGDEEALFRLVRREFPFGEDRVPMNAANLCPSPRAVADAVSELTRDIDRDCSFQNRAKFADYREAAREAVAAMLGASPDEVALTRNTSEANNIVNAGLALGAGDEVLVWDQNHPTNNVAWEVRAARHGFAVRRVGVPAAPKDLAEPFVSAFGPATRVVALTQVSNVSGIHLPVRQIADAARERGILVHVDGAQSFGGVEVDVRALGADTFTSSSHKWFCGPKECGVLFVREERIPGIWPSVVAPGWGADADPDPTGARKFESMGQRDDACLAAMETTAAFHGEIGGARIETRMRWLARRLKEGAAALGLPLVTPMDDALSAGVVIVEVPAENRREVFSRMYEEHGIAGSTSGGFRLSPHLYNTEEHLERALAGLEALRPLIRPA